MWFKYCLFLCTALTADTVKVDLLGSLTLGSDVAEFLSQYLKEDVVGSVSGRRSNTDAFEELIKVAKNMQPCKNINICTGELEAFLTNYVSALLISVKSVFNVLEDELCKVRYFQKCLKHYKKVVKDSTSDSDEVYRWINILKRISGKFLEQSMELSSLGLDKVARKELAGNALKQQLVVKIMDVEKEYLAKLCKMFSFCPYQYDATIYLQLLLNIIKNMEEKEVRLFINQFQRKFLRSPLFTDDKATLKKFDDILKEMVVQRSVATKDVILSISDIVQKRLSVAESSGDSKDTVLLKGILADMDHLYLNNKGEPIEAFLDAVKSWMKSKDLNTLNNGMEALYSGLGQHFSNQPVELVYKLKTEVQVFLDAIVDPISNR